MALKQPLVVYDGQIAEIQAGDTLSGSSGGSSLYIASTPLSFGNTGTKGKLFVINDANILSTSKVVSIIYTPVTYIDRGVFMEANDDDEFDSLHFSVRSINTNELIIYVKSEGLINKQKTIQYTIQ